MEPTLVYREAADLVGLTAVIIKASGPSTENRDRIAALWKKLAAEAPPGALAGQRAALMEQPSGALGEEEEYFGGLLWPADQETPAGLIRKKLLAGNYFYYLQKGPISLLGKSLSLIYGHWLPQSGRLRGSGPDLVLYPASGEPMSDEFELKLFVPLRVGE